MDEYHQLYKILLIGDSGTGKSSIVKRFVDNEYSSSFMSTIGVDFKIKTVQTENSVVKLQIWDCAGQERFKTLTKAYYRGAHGVIIVYDVTDPETFANVETWLDEVDNHLDLSVPKLLVGNKIDLKKQVDTEQVVKLAEKYDMNIVECSAKNNININGIFVTLIHDIQKIPEKHQDLKQSISFNTSPVKNDNCCSY